MKQSAKHAILSTGSSCHNMPEMSLMRCRLALGISSGGEAPSMRPQASTWATPCGKIAQPIIRISR